MKIKFNSKSTYVDKNSGEILTKKDIANKSYRVIKTTRKIIINNETSRTIEYTNECTRNAYRQQTLMG
jgi:hypothetical protein